MARATDIPIESRRAVHARDQGKCRMCGRHADAPELHHIVYRSQERNNHAPENLITLDYAHHRLAHTRPGLIRPVLQTLVQEGGRTGLSILRSQGVDLRSLSKGTL